MPHPAPRVGRGGVRRRKPRPEVARDPHRDAGLACRGRAPARGGHREPPEHRSLRRSPGDPRGIPDRATHREPHDAGGGDAGSGRRLRQAAGRGAFARGSRRDRRGGPTRAARRWHLDLAASPARRAVRRRQRRLAGDPCPMADRRSDGRCGARGRPRDRRCPGSPRRRVTAASAPGRASPSRLVATGRRRVDRVDGSRRRLPVDRIRAMATRPVERCPVRIVTSGHLHRWCRAGQDRVPRWRTSRAGGDVRPMGFERLEALRIGLHRSPDRSGTQRLSSIARRSRIASAIGPRSPSVTSIARS